MPNNAAKTPGKASKVGRKPNGTLEEMDKDCQIQAAEKVQATEKVQDEVPGNAEQEASSSKRPAEEQSGPVKKAKKKAKAQEEPQQEESSYGETSSTDSAPSSEVESSSSSSSDSSDQEKKTKKSKNGFIGFKNNVLITVDNRCNLRKILKLFKDQGSLMDRIDKYGKTKHQENFDSVAENLRFVEELFKAVKNEVPRENRLKKKTMKDVKTLKTCLQELHRDLNPASDTPQWGYHLLDWSQSEELIAVIGKSLARRIRTALKGQRKSNKLLFSKSPQEVNLTWLGRAERARKTDSRKRPAPFQPRNNSMRTWSDQRPTFSNNNNNNKFTKFTKK